MPAGKHYDLSFERRDDYLYVLLKADTIDRPTALEYLAEVWAEAAESKFRQILLQREIAAIGPPDDGRIEVIDAGRLGTGVRMAFVDISKTPRLDPIEFNILTGAEYRRFNTIRQAERWLKAGPA